MAYNIEYTFQSIYIEYILSQGGVDFLLFLVFKTIVRRTSTCCRRVSLTLNPGVLSSRSVPPITSCSLVTWPEPCTTGSNVEALLRWLWVPHVTSSFNKLQSYECVGGKTKSFYMGPCPDNHLFFFPLWFCTSYILPACVYVCMCVLSAGAIVFVYFVCNFIFSLFECIFLEIYRVQLSWLIFCLSYS